VAHAQEKQERDSIAIAEKNEAMQKASHKPRKVVEPLQNWHVIEGKIAEPVAKEPVAKEPVAK
jgi:hypothetical protein